MDFRGGDGGAGLARVIIELYSQEQTRGTIQYENL